MNAAPPTTSPSIFEALVADVAVAQSELDSALGAVDTEFQKPETGLALFAAMLHHQYALLFEFTGNGCYPWAMFRLCRQTAAEIPAWVLRYFDECAHAVKEGHRGRVKPAQIAQGLRLAKSGGGESIWTQQDTWNRNYFLVQQTLREMERQQGNRLMGKSHDDDSTVFVNIAERYNGGEWDSVVARKQDDTLDAWTLRKIYSTLTTFDPESPAGRRSIAHPSIHRSV